ncbi:DUF1740-domain-containing protein [Lepidopterella palustris CBS 459.81]|uniref:DUF1740-domain-containing protein n=1 Tax=Lepidopterella palustris CBS 459.81 TaxID=1314670 RepID=A0A8E2JA48_9PEZI|nr:DUF1740-domain-containing protein [Lepidopterella palustris CBS 459.81]
MTDSNIPKFASFRPKPSSEVKTTTSNEIDILPSKPSDRSREERSKNYEKRQRSRSRSREKKRKHSRRHSGSRDSRDVQKTLGKDSLPKVAITSWDEESSSYTIDRKGDPANLTFGSLHRYNIPAYRRYGSGCILGVSIDRRIDRASTTEREIYVEDGRHFTGSERQLISRRASNKEPRTLRFVKPIGNDAQLDSRLDYIPIMSVTKRKRGSQSPVSSNENHVDYRSIEGKAKAKDRPIDPDTVYSSDLDDDNPDLETMDDEYEVRQQNARLSRRTKEEPHNLQAWLDFIDHQEAMVRLGHSNPSQKLSASERRGLADIRITMYEQALQNIGSNGQYQEQLLLGLMEEGSKYWESKKLATKWQEILHEYPESIRLWTTYLDFAQTNFVSFKYEIVRAKFRNCLEILAKDRSGKFLLEIQLYILLRMTSMMKDAGYQELAIATWQALLEYHLFRPGSTTKVWEKGDLLLSFEDFWESEVPRIGEPDATGWSQFLVNPGDAPAPVNISLRQTVAPENMFEDFAEMESEHMLALRYPGRTGDEAGDDDPFHLVLFSDIEEVLSLIPQNLPPESLIQAFLCFCHLPPLPDQNIPGQQSWWQESFLRDERLKNTTSKSHEPFPGGGDVRTNAFSDAMNIFSTFPMKSFRMTTDSLFQGGFTRPRDTIDVDFVRRALQQITSSSTNDLIAEYLLAFELSYFPTDASKAAKQLIKKNPSSLRLYNAYALIEARRGNTTISDHVFATALGMCKSLPGSAQRDSILLWHTWIWEALNRGDKDTAMHRLLSIGEAKLSEQQQAGWTISDATPAAVLKARTHLRDALAHSLSTTQYSNSILYTTLLALLSYLQPSSSSSYSNISAALAIYNSTHTLLERRNLAASASAELNHQARAHLLAFHSSYTRSFKPAVLREELVGSIRQFRGNTYLMEVYAANEARSRIDNRVRDIMRDIVLRGGRDQGATGVVGWCFSIFAEMKRAESALGVSTVHSVRAAFERAVGEGAGGSCQGLWTSFVLFELSQSAKVDRQKIDAKGKKEKDKGRAGLGLERVKSIYLRGLTHLPWCKEYMLLAFQERMRGVLGEHDLRRVWNVLVEKECRVFVDLGSVFEEWEKMEGEEKMGLVVPEDNDGEIGGE